MYFIGKIVAGRHSSLSPVGVRLNGARRPWADLEAMRVRQCFYTV